MKRTKLLELIEKIRETKKPEFFEINSTGSKVSYLKICLIGDSIRLKSYLDAERMFSQKEEHYIRRIDLDEVSDSCLVGMDSFCNTLAFYEIDLNSIRLINAKDYEISTI